MSVPWVVTPEKMEKAVRKIVGVEQPKKVILFGSAVRGETGLNSNADFLVADRQVTVTLGTPILR